MSSSIHLGCPKRLRVVHLQQIEPDVHAVQEFVAGQASWKLGIDSQVGQALVHPVTVDVGRSGRGLRAGARDPAEGDYGPSTRALALWRGQAVRLLLLP